MFSKMAYQDRPSHLEGISDMIFLSQPTPPCSILQSHSAHTIEQEKKLQHIVRGKTLTHIIDFKNTLEQQHLTNS